MLVPNSQQSRMVYREVTLKLKSRCASKGKALETGDIWQTCGDGEKSSRVPFDVKTSSTSFVHERQSIPFAPGMEHVADRTYLFESTAWYIYVWSCDVSPRFALTVGTFKESWYSGNVHRLCTLLSQLWIPCVASYVHYNAKKCPEHGGACGSRVRIVSPKRTRCRCPHKLSLNRVGEAVDTLNETRTVEDCARGVLDQPSSAEEALACNGIVPMATCTAEMLSFSSAHPFETLCPKEELPPYSRKSIAE